jgi:uncharacterized protein
MCHTTGQPWTCSIADIESLEMAIGSRWYRPEDEMTDVDNIAVGQTYVRALSNRDMTTVGVLLADDVVWHQPGTGRLSGTVRGKASVQAHLVRFLALSHNSFCVNAVGTVMANGPLVAAQLHVVATRPGKALSMDGLDLMRIEHGQIKEMWLFSGDQVAEDAFWGE